jgi:hypothetical protein
MSLCADNAKFFLHNAKDAPNVWSVFNTLEERSNYINQTGGTFDLREGETLNPKWIVEVKTFYENHPEYVK